jgi:Flp pilus assembly protein TadD
MTAPDPVGLYHQALDEFNHGNTTHALGLLQQVISISPNLAPCHFVLGRVHERLNQIDQAISAYGQALCLDPDSEEALVNYQRCIEQVPDAADAYNHLGISFARANRLQQAEQCFQRAIELAPGHAIAYNNRGLLFKSCARYAEAIANYRRAIRLDPDYANAHWNLALTLLLTGDFTEGWEEFKWRRRANLDAILPTQRREPPTWEGTPFRHQCLLIRYEQGLGDNIQCIRYLPLVKRLGGRVAVESQSELLGLFKLIPEIDELVEATVDGSPRITCDLFAFAMDLPGILKTRLDTIPTNTPYLYTDIEKKILWQQRLTDKAFNVGIVWAGSPKHTNDGQRSCSLDCFAPLARIPKVRLFSLQKGPADEQLSRINFPIENLAPKLHDFADTAALIEALDLVISVDTACLHLAGALDQPAWGLLPSVPDWRWLTDREDSPWYRSLTLFRQPKLHDWQSVFTRIILRLNDLVQKYHS